MTALLWMWHYGSLDMHECDGDWVEMFHVFDDSDECAMDGVEVDGRFIDRDVVRNLPEYKAIDARQWERYRERTQAVRAMSTVALRHPTFDKWAAVMTDEPDKVNRKADELRARYGADRVKVTPR